MKRVFAFRYTISSSCRPPLFSVLFPPPSSYLLTFLPLSSLQPPFLRPTSHYSSSLLPASLPPPSCFFMPPRSSSPPCSFLPLNQTSLLPLSPLPFYLSLILFRLALLTFLPSFPRCVLICSSMFSFLLRPLSLSPAPALL